VIGIAEDIARELVDTYCVRELHPTRASGMSRNSSPK